MIRPGGQGLDPERIPSFKSRDRVSEAATVVVYLDRKIYREDPGTIDVQGALGMFFVVRYGIMKLWEVDPAALLGRESPGLCSSGVWEPDGPLAKTS